MPERLDIWWGIDAKRWWMMWALGEAAFKEPGFGYVTGGLASLDTMPIQGLTSPPTRPQKDEA